MEDPKSKRIYDLNIARERIRKYCVYRDRSHAEVTSKLYDYGLIPEVVNELLAELIQENYLDEERFARSFVRGKFRTKKWGRQKIRKALYPHKLSDYVLNAAFSEIDDEEYLSCLRDLMEKKDRSLRDTNQYVRRGKLAAYLIRKGFESELVWDLIRNPGDQ